MDKKFGQKLELIIKLFKQAEKYFMAKIQSMKLEKDRLERRQHFILMVTLYWCGSV